VRRVVVLMNLRMDIMMERDGEMEMRGLLRGRDGGEEEGGVAT
jgi:hypothetical protein